MSPLRAVSGRLTGSATYLIASKRLPLTRRLASIQASITAALHEQHEAEGRYFLKCLQGRHWLLASPLSKMKVITPESPDGTASFQLIQDDLLHPVLGGNKIRKLDALLPKLISDGITDVSAHTAAVAAACAEQGMRAHLLVRGERPAVPTGLHLLARMFGHVTYISRSEYSNRAALLSKYERIISEKQIDSKVFVLAEGGADSYAMLGFVRLVQQLAASKSLCPASKHTFVIDSGTGTTAIGLAVGIALLQLPWKVVGIMLAGPASYYKQQQEQLTSTFGSAFGAAPSNLPLEWQERLQRRKFGTVYPKEIEACAEIAKEHGVLLDPIYTLAAWEIASQLCQRQPCGGQFTESIREGSVEGHENVVMLHSGGAGGLHGLAQRYPNCF